MHSFIEIVVFSLSLNRIKNEAPVPSVIGGDSCTIKHTSTVNSNGGFFMHRVHCRKSMGSYLRLAYAC